MKIILGTTNIANILSGLDFGFKALGHDVTTVVKEVSPYYDHSQFTRIYRKFDNVNPKAKILKRLVEKYDYANQRKRLRKFLQNTLPETDLFVFVWSSFMPELGDLKQIKAAGKKVVILFAGSEVRYSKAFSTEFNIDISAWDAGLREDNFEEKLKFVREAEKYADLILSVPDQSGLMVRPYNHAFMPINMHEYSCNPSLNDVITVLHAPTRTGAKGTEYFNDAVNRLKAEGFKFEYKFIQNVSNQELKGMLAHSDVLLDEIYTHGPGVLATEAMASCCVVLTRTLESNKHIFDPPVLNVNKETIYSVLKEVLSKPELIKMYKEKGREFVVRHNSANVVCQNIIDFLNHPQKKHDYSPTFFSLNAKKFGQ